MNSDIVSSTQVYDEQYNVVAIRVVREAPDGTRTESIVPVEAGDEPPESPADRMWRKD